MKNKTITKLWIMISIIFLSMLISKVSYAVATGNLTDKAKEISSSDINIITISKTKMKVNGNITSDWVTTNSNTGYSTGNGQMHYLTKDKTYTITYEEAFTLNGTKMNLSISIKPTVTDKTNSSYVSLGIATDNDIDLYNLKSKADITYEIKTAGGQTVTNYFCYGFEDPDGGDYLFPSGTTNANYEVYYKNPNTANSSFANAYKIESNGIKRQAFTYDFDKALFLISYNTVHESKFTINWSTTEGGGGDWLDLPRLYYVPGIAVYFNMNGGSLASQHGEGYGTEGDYVTRNNSRILHWLKAGQTLSSNGLGDYNNPSYMKIVRTGYYVESGKEYNTKADGSGTYLNQTTSYTYDYLKTFKDEQSVVTLYVQWKPSSVTVTFNPNGGTVDKTTMTSKTGYPIGNSNDNILGRWNVLPPSSAGSDHKLKKAFVADSSLANGRAVKLSRTEAATTTGGYHYSQPGEQPIGETYTFTVPAKGSGTWKIGFEQSGTMTVTLQSSRYVPYSKVFTTGDTTYHSTIFYAQTMLASDYIQYGAPIIQEGGLTPLPVATRPGYKFKGWYTAASGGTRVDDENHTTIITPSSNKTYYAQWEIAKVNIGICLNGGYLSRTHGSTVGTVDFEGQTYITVNGSSFVRTGNYGGTIGPDGLPDYNNSSYINVLRRGYHVNINEVYRNRTSTSTHYNDLYDQTTEYNTSDFDDCTTGDKTVRLYVKWVADNYNINYTLNGGTNGSENPATYTIESDNITINNPTKTGYTFNGWSESISNIAWEEGFVNISTGELEESTTYPLSYRTGMIKLKAGKTYTLSGYGDYASSGIRWRIYDSSGNYLGQNSGGSVSGNTYTPTTDCQAIIVFYQESTAAQRNGTILTVSGLDSNITIPTGSTGNITLTANWQANDYTIAYTLNNGAWGTGAVHPTSGTFDQNVNISNPTRTGYTFTGWTMTNGNTSTAKYGTSTSNVTTAWNPATTLVTAQYFKNLRSEAGTVTLVANWIGNQSNVVIDPAGGSTIVYNDNHNIINTMNGNETITTAKTYTGRYNDTLSMSYPQKDPTTNSTDYHITYEGNEGTVGTTTNANTIATRTDTTSYTFNDWTKNLVNGSWGQTQVSGAGATVNGYIFGPNANMTDTLTATYTSSTTSNTTPVILANATRPGYTLKGWYTASSGGTKRGNAGDTYTPSGNETLYAQWTANTATVTIKKDNSNWTTNNNVVVELRSSTNTYNGTKSGAAFTWTAIPSGTYDIYASKNDTNQTNINTLIDTGIDVIVSSTGTATIDYYSLQLQAGVGISAVSGVGTYLKNQQANIDATVATGYTWQGWSVISGNTPN